MTKLLKNERNIVNLREIQRLVKVFEYLQKTLMNISCQLYVTFRNFVNAVMLADCGDYIDTIRKKSKNLYTSYKTFSANIKQILRTLFKYDCRSIDYVEVNTLYTPCIFQAM